MKMIITGIYTKPLKSHKIMKTKWSSVLLVSIISFLTAGGCASHIYNAEDASLAGKAQKQIVALSKSHQTVFGTMSENLETMSRLEQNLYNEMGKKESEIQARNVMEMPWRELRNQFSKNGLANSLSVKIQSNIAKIQEELRQVQGKKGNVTASLENAKSELVLAKQILTGWNRRVAVLEKLIEVTPSIEKALSEVETEDGFKKKVEDLAKSVENKVEESKVTYADADGNEKKTDLKKEIPKLLDVNKSLLNKSESGKIVAGIRAIVNPDAPGLIVTVAALAKDLAEGESNNLLAHIDSLEKRLEVLSRAKELVEIAQDFATEAISKISVENFTEDDKVIDTLKILAEKDPNGILANAILATQHYVTIVGPITTNVEYAVREDAYLQHLQSIEISRINTIQQEALVARGIEGLVTYHEGGIRSKDLADIAYGITQLSLLGWIGAKTDD